jgi:CcmD family protein
MNYLIAAYGVILSAIVMYQVSLIARRRRLMAFLREHPGTKKSAE